MGWRALLGEGERRLSRSLEPPNLADKRIRVEQLRAIALNNQKMMALPIVATLLVIVAVQWVSLLRMLVWLVLVLAAFALMVVGSRRLIRLNIGSGLFTIRLLLVCMPFMLLWSTYMLFAWVPTNLLNNAFLVVFLLASMVAGVAEIGICRYIAFPGMALDLPLLATHTFAGSHEMNFLMSVLQVAAGLLICNLSLSFESSFRTFAVQLLEKEGLADELSSAATQLTAARDAAEKANRSKSEFLANMSHELRTPLNAIIGFSDMIRNRAFGPVSPTKYGDYVEDIYKSGTYLLDLINSLLDLAKIEAGRLELNEVCVNISHLTTDVFRFVEVQARKGDVILAAEIDERLRLHADERAISRVLTNLVSNAVKFTPPGGTVTVYANAMDDGWITLGVKDTGMGMHQTEVARAMEPFTQVAQITTVDGWGTGLGLPLVKALVELHGGGFYIESHRGIGSCAWAEFPADRNIAPPLDSALPRRIAN